jgi:hypothetical protein
MTLGRTPGFGAPRTAEAAPPYPIVHVVAPDLLDAFVDGNGSASNNVSPAGGLDISEILIGDQSTTFAGNFNLKPDPNETVLMSQLAGTPPQISSTDGYAGSPSGLGGSLAMVTYVDGVAGVTFTGSDAGVLFGEALNTAPPHFVPAVNAGTGVCGSLGAYLANAADIPDGDCDSAPDGPMNYAAAVVPGTGACVAHIALTNPGGAATGSTATSMTDGAASFPPGGAQGAKLTMGGSTATITTNTGTVLNFTAWSPPAPATGAYTITAPNDPTCREDGLVIMHMLIHPTRLANTPGTVTATVTAGGTKTVSFIERGPVTAVNAYVLPDGPPSSPFNDPLVAFGPAPNCPFTNTGFAALATWAGAGPVSGALSVALVTPSDGANDLTRRKVSWTSSLSAAVGVRETTTTSYFVPASLPGVPAVLSGKIVAGNLLCAGLLFPALQTVTAASGAGSLPFTVTVAPPPMVAIDMNIANGTGPCTVLDSAATLAQGANLTVAICQLAFTGSPAAFNYQIAYDDTKVSVPEVADAGTGLDDNPDANAGVTTFGPNLGTGWDCSGGGLAYPTGDIEPATGPGNGKAFSGSCGSPGGPYTLGGSGILGLMTVHGDAIGTTPLTLKSVKIFGEDGAETGSCSPAFAAPATCVSGTLTVQAPQIVKTPSKANLFLCLGLTCSTYGNGAGSLTIDEVATVPGPTGFCTNPPQYTPGLPNSTLGCTLDQNNDGREDGVGAVEFQVKFDHKVFNVAIVPGTWLTAGTTRSQQCNNTIVTENWILFGCTSTGPAIDPAAPGAASGGLPNSGTIAQVVLTPNEDMKSRLHPGDNNGVVRLILDENCELANIFGEPLAYSVGGGMLQTCADASVTMRILEGDLNLDCTVNVLDQQAIAFRYGSFFGDLSYDPWFDVEPSLKDFDVDVKDLQKVFGRDGSTCAAPIPPQPPLSGLSVGPL